MKGLLTSILTVLTFTGLQAHMACSLIKHKRITTTVAKAKALKKFVEPLITRSKDDTTNSRRVVFSNLQDKQVVTEQMCIRDRCS